jgi:hypothetical protein
MRRRSVHSGLSNHAFWAIALVVAGLAALVTPSLNALAENQGNPNPGIMPPHARAHGQPYGEWAAEWWTWVLQIPEEQNPLFDTTGEFCGVDQAGDVWFLAGVTGAGGTVTRTCEIPAGKALFFPVLNVRWTNEPTDPPFNEDEVRAILAWVIDTFAADVSCEIDGEAVEDIDAYRFQSPVFELPEDNYMGWDPDDGYGPCVDDGYYLMLAPLSVGKHTIRFTGCLGEGFSLDVTYKITIVPDDEDE